MSMSSNFGALVADGYDHDVLATLEVSVDFIQLVEDKTLRQLSELSRDRKSSVDCGAGVCGVACVD